MAVTKNPKHTFNFDILLQTKLKQQDWRKHKQQLEDEFQNLQIGIQEGMAAESAQKVVDIFNQAFEKVNMPKIDVSALQSDLDNVAKSFTEALAKINNIDTSALKGIETTLGHISDTLDDIAPKVGQNVKKATKSAMLSVSQLDKMLAETGESIKEVEAALKFTGKGKRGSAKTGEIELSTVKELYKEYGKLTAEIKGIDTEEDKHWLARNQAMIKFVKAYEGLSKEVKAGLDDTTRESLKKAYDFAQPKANAARTNLQNLVDRRAGTFSEFREPWARESTLQDIKKILSDGISVKGDGKKSQAQLQAEIDREQSVIAETTGEIKSILENLQKNKTYVMYRGVNASESDKIQQRSDIYNSKDGYGAEYYINSKKIASKYAPDDDGSGHVISAEISPKHPILYDAKGKDYQDIITDQEFINWFKKQHKSFNNLDLSTKLSGSDANQLVMNQAARKAGFDAIIFDNVLDHPINDSTGEGTSKASELGRTIAVLSDNILKITGFFDVIDGKVSKEISKDRPYYYRMPDGQDVSEPTEEGLERAQLEKDLQEAERAKRRAEKNVKELQAQLQEAPAASGGTQGAQQEKVVIADGVATEETLGKILAILEGKRDSDTGDVSGSNTAPAPATNDDDSSKLFPDGTKLDEQESAMVAKYLDIMKKKMGENYDEAMHLKAALDLVFNIKSRNIEEIMDRFTNGNDASNAVLNMATNMPINNQQNRNAALRSLDEAEYDRIVAERKAAITDDQTEFQKKWEELASAMIGENAFKDVDNLKKGKIVKAFEELGGTVKEGIDKVNKMWLAGALEGQSFKNKYIQTYVNHLNSEQEYYDDLRDAKEGDLDVDGLLSGKSDAKLTEEKAQALKYLASVYDELIAKKKEYYGIGTSGVSTRTEADVESARKVAEYDAQSQADAEQRTLELTRQKAEEEARITEEKQQQLELDKTVVESQKEKPKPLLPTADGLEAHTYAPSDEQKAYVLKLGEEYRAIMEILERGDSEFEAALIERAKAISKIMLETVRGSDGTIEHMYKDVYGGDAKTTSVLGDWRQKDRLLHNVDSNKIDESQRQAAIDLIYQELEAEKQLEAERLKAREAAKQRELDTFKSKYSSASEEEKKLLYEIIELEKEHRTLADIGDEESHKLALEALQKVREKYNALEKLNEDLLDAYDDVGFKRAAPYVDTPSIVAHPIEEYAIDTPEEQSHLSKLKDSVDGVTAAVKEKTQEFLNEKTAVKKSAQSEVHALGEVEKKVTEIRVALSNVNTLMNSIQKGNDISQLSDVKVTVNYPEQQDDYKQLVGQIKDAIGSPQEEKYDDDEDSQQVKHVADILTRIKVHTHNTVRQIRDNLIGNLETQFSNLKNNVYNVKIAHDDNDKQANKVAIDAEELEGVLRRVLTTTPADADSTDAENPNTKTQIDGLVAQYKRALATIAEWQTLYQSLDNLPSTNKPAEQRKHVLEAVNGISPELAHMIGGTFEEAFKTGFKGVKTKDIARQVSRIAEESMFGYVPEQVEMLQKLNVDNFDFDKLPIQKASIDALNPVFELLKQIDDIRKGAVDVGVDDQDDEMPETPKEAYALDSTLQEVKKVLDKIAVNTASLNGVEIQRAVEKNTEATEGIAPEVAKETSTVVAEETNNVAKVIEKKRADSEGNINSEYANSRTVVRGQKTSDSYQTVKTRMVPEFDEETEEFKGYKTTLVEIIDDFDKIRKENLKAQKDLVRAQKKVSEFLAKFQSKTGGNAQYVEGFSDLQNMAKHIDASNIDLAYNKMIELQQKYAELERNFRKGQSSLNPFVNAINRSENIGNIFGDVQDKFDGLIKKSDVLTTKFAALEELAKKIQGFTQTMKTNPESITPKDFTEFSQWMGEFTAIKTQVDSMIRSEKAVEKENAAKNAEHAKEVNSLTVYYEKLGKLRAKFEGSGDLNDKEDLKILAEKVAKTRESMNLTFEEIQLLRAKSDEAYKSELRLVEAAKKQKALDEQKKAEEKSAQDASKQADKEAAKQAKKQAAEAKRAAKREAMFGKAGNAIGRAENLWMNAQGEDGLPENLIAQVDALYKKMGALRKEQDKVRNAETITKKQQKNLRNHTIEMNALTNEVSELFTEYQKLSGATVDETKTKATSLTSKSSLGDYENELKRYVKSIEGGKAQIKGFDAATRTLTYTVKTGKNEFTEYTAAVRRADGALVSVQGSTKRTETFLEATKRKMKELTSYMSGMALFSRATQELRRGIQYVREIDDALVELRKVTDETDESYDKFLRTAAKTGSVIGATISEVTEATATFSKLGYDMEMATEMAESAIVYKNVGDNIASAEDAADSIISTLKGFRLESSETMRIVDRFNEVGKSIAHVI